MVIIGFSTTDLPLFCLMLAFYFVVVHLTNSLVTTWIAFSTRNSKHFLPMKINISFALLLLSVHLSDFTVYCPGVLNPVYGSNGTAVASSGEYFMFASTEEALLGVNMLSDEEGNTGYVVLQRVVAHRVKFDADVRENTSVKIKFSLQGPRTYWSMNTKQWIVTIGDFNQAAFFQFTLVADDEYLYNIDYVSGSSKYPLVVDEFNRLGILGQERLKITLGGAQ